MMNPLFWLAFLFCTAGFAADLVWSDRNLAKESLGGKGVFLLESGTRILEFRKTSDAKSPLLRIPLDASAIASRRVVLSAEVRTDLKPSGRPSAGARLLLTGKRGEKGFYSASPIPSGRNAWKKFTFVTDVPGDLEYAALFLGIQHDLGTVQFRNIRLEAGDGLLNLVPFANMGFSDRISGDGTGGWTDQGPEKDASKFDYRKKEFCGIPFAIIQPRPGKEKCVLVFQSPNFKQGIREAQADLTHIRLSGTYLYLLHTLAYGRGKAVFGTVELTGKNGMKQTLALRSGQEAADWRNPTRLVNGFVASMWMTPALGPCGIYLSRLPLDTSLGEIRTITFRSSGENPIWILLAATISKQKYDFPSDEIHTTTAGKEWKAQPVRRQGILAGSALDRSFLNPAHRAGDFGRVVAGKNGRLEFERRPGVPVRFFASADGLDTFCGRAPVPAELSDKKQIAEYVRQLRLHGYNMVRLHGVDLPLMRNPEPGEKYSRAFLDRLDYFIFQLKENGIYLNLDGMKSTLGYTPGNPYAKNISSFKDRIYYDPAVRENWKWGLELLLTHRNPYTGTRLAEDPVLAVVVGYNEQEFAFLHEKDFSPMRSAWQDFLKRKHGSVNALKTAWGEPKAAWKTFGDIPGFRLSDFSSLHGVDLAEFLVETERNMTQWYRETLRAMGYRGLVSNYNMSKLFRSILSRSASDLVTMNGYHAHPSAYNQPGSTIPQHSSISDAANQARSFFSAAVYGKPFMITEHGHAFWNQYRYEQAFVTGAYSAFQGLDGLTAFAQPVSIQKSSFINPFNIRFDPIARAQEFLTAFLFLRRDVTEAERVARIPLAEREVFSMRLFNEALSGRQSRLSLLTGFRLDVDSKQPFGAHEFMIARSGSSSMRVSEAHAEILEAHAAGSDGDFDRVVETLKKRGILCPGNRTDPGREIYESSTGELYLDAPKHFMRIETPRLEGICGEAGSRAVFPTLEICAMSRRGNLALVALDGGKKLSECARMVLVYATDARNSGMTFQDRDATILLKNGTAPILVGTGRFRVRIARNGFSDLVAYALRDDGSRMKRLLVSGFETFFELNVDTSSFEEEVPLYFEIIRKHSTGEN